MKILQRICSSVFLVIALNAQGYADEHFPFLGEVSRESVNIRAGANTNFEKLDKLAHGTQVVVVWHVYEWYKIQLPATSKAYIRADYLKLQDGSSIVQVIGDKVNVRARADSESASLGQMTKGRFVKVVEEKNGWCLIEPTVGIVGFVHQDFLSVKSTEVPAGLLTQPLTETSVVTAVAPPAPAAAVVEKPQEPILAVKGRLESLSAQVQGQPRYQLVIDGKPAYYLQDDNVPMNHFANAMVDVEGHVVSSKSQAQATYPLVHITKIKLIL